MNLEERDKKMSQIIAKCWADEGFKRKLLDDPAATLKAEGVELPAGLSIKAVENNDKLVHVVIPARPAELSDEYLDQVAGGMTMGHNPKPDVLTEWDQIKCAFTWDYTK
jgi:Nitrile hydratase, alpha chain